MSCCCQTLTAGDPHRHDSCENSWHKIHLLYFPLNILKLQLSFQLVCQAAFKERHQWVLKGWRFISYEGAFNTISHEKLDIAEVYWH